MKYPLMIPNITESDISAITDVLRSGMLTQGVQVGLLEETISSKTDVVESIAVSNGTASLHLALIALGVGPGDEVIVPAFSYIATANVVELVGATPIFVDIELSTFTIDTSKIESAISTKTKAIIPVHEFGLAAEITKICQIASKHSIFVIEDAACALGAMENNIPVGSFGDLGSFSFHPRKSITSGEGGIITTKSSKLSSHCRSLRNHGIDPDNKSSMEFVAAGYNYRLTDIQAAMLNSQLTRFNEMLEVKSILANVYLNELNESACIVPSIPENKNHTWQTFHIVLDEAISQEKIISELKGKGIGTNYGAQCIPDQTFYKNKYGFDSKTLFPNAYRAYKSGLAIPLYYGLTDTDISIISMQINNSFQNVKK
jgi:dTDP-4-amino-4,6-dideoxygalactose transaminase